MLDGRRRQGDNRTAATALLPQSRFAARLVRTRPHSNRVSIGECMHLENPKTWTSLRRVVALFTSDPTQQEDLLQEAVLRLWMLEQRRPGQRPSWYLHGCKLHLRNLQRAGSSIDSPKRAGRTRFLPGWPHGTAADEIDPELETVNSDSSPLSDLSVRDVVAEMSMRLTPKESRVFQLLIDGFTAREAAEKAAMSHTRVNKIRHKLAAVANRLGITPSRCERRTARRGWASFERRVSISAAELLVRAEPQT
jgi:DNA-directed RNA polymerase specialized sigma24 family protein